MALGTREARHVRVARGMPAPHIAWVYVPALCPPAGAQAPQPAKRGADGPAADAGGPARRRDDAGLTASDSDFE